MSYIPIPENSILDGYEKYRVIGDRQVWRHKKRFFTWDGLHGEIEVFDANGYHLGAINPLTGELVKEPVKGRTLNVR